MSSTYTIVVSDFLPKLQLSANPEPPASTAIPKILQRLPLAMPRQRSHSVVQKIALQLPPGLDVPPRSSIAVNNPTLTEKPIPLRKHLHSKRNLPSHVLYPLSSHESDAVASAFLDLLNYNSVLDLSHIANVNNLLDGNFMNFSDECAANIAYCDDLLGESAHISAQLADLRAYYDRIVADTTDFAAQSSRLLESQADLQSRVSQMDHVLQMFEPLDRITKTLGLAGNAIIRSGRVHSILLQLQECLDFLELHPTYKDSDIYAVRYRRCMTRGLTLVRNYLVDTLKAKSAEISASLAEKSDLSIEVFAYTKFASDLEKQDGRFAQLVSTLVAKSDSHSDYRGLVSDVLWQYFNIRLHLMLEYLKQEPNREAKSTLQYCQREIAVFKRLLGKEYNLFVSYFAFSDQLEMGQIFLKEELNSFFKQALEPLYDDVRDRILREPSISELCHLTNLLTTYNEFDEEASVVTSGDLQIEYGELFEPMLNDAQSRLIFRIQNYIDNKLLPYKPQPEDLDLASRKRPRKDSSLDEFDENLFPSLYVPLGKALTILSNIYELVNSMVFDDIAHYIVHSCMYMLRQGTLKLAITHLGTVDAKLFLLKNLILLKNQLANFDIQHVRTDTTLDLTGGIGEIISIFRSGELLVKFNERGGFLQLVKKSVPRVVNNMIDANHEIDLELSNAVNDFVTECANVVCEPILANPKSIKETVLALNDSVLVKLPHLIAQMKVFIDEPEIVQHLTNMMTDLVALTYTKFYDSIPATIGNAQANAEVEDIMEPDSFLNFLQDTVQTARDEESEPKFNEDMLAELDNDMMKLEVDSDGRASPQNTEFDEKKALAENESGKTQSESIALVPQPNTGEVAGDLSS